MKDNLRCGQGGKEDGRSYTHNDTVKWTMKAKMAFV